jgi:signal transduction histidine kinase
MKDFFKSLDFLIGRGTKPSDSAARARSIRMSNLIGLSVVLNTSLTVLIFLYLEDYQLVKAGSLINVLYLASCISTFVGYPTLGRTLLLLFGNLTIFYFSSIFRGSLNLQFLFFSLSVSPFMFFSWEERKFYGFGLLSVFLFLLGEYYDWSFFVAHPHLYSSKIFRLLFILASSYQVIGGFLYFLFQSVKFEAESIENLRKLELVHIQQMQVQKMTSLGEMSGGVSHEINNPLMIISGKVLHIKRELSKSLPLENASFAHLEIIERMVERISQIILALRTFSRNSVRDPSEIVLVKDIVNMTLDLCRERYTSSGIELELDFESGLKISCRPVEISQVLLNLLNNSYDAVKTASKPKIKIESRSTGDCVEILVQDNGVGVSSDVAIKMMDPFFTTKEIGKGTGLGLSISKGLIESHRGTLNYLSDEELTTFQIKLPQVLV